MSTMCSSFSLSTQSRKCLTEQRPLQAAMMGRMIQTQLVSLGHENCGNLKVSVLEMLNISIRICQIFSHLSENLNECKYSNRMWFIYRGRRHRSRRYHQETQTEGPDDLHGWVGCHHIPGNSHVSSFSEFHFVGWFQSVAIQDPHPNVSLCVKK